MDQKQTTSLFKKEKVKLSDCLLKFQLFCKVLNNFLALLLRKTSLISLIYFIFLLYHKVLKFCSN